MPDICLLEMQLSVHIYSGQLSNCIYNVTYLSISVRPIICVYMQGQLSFYVHKTSYQHLPAEPVIFLNLQGHVSVYI